jgi:hypothetical protein
MPNKGWQRKFDDPIPLPGGRKLVTLRDAGDYITKPVEERVRRATMANGDRGSNAVYPWR